MSDHLLILSLGPVQGFIAAARRSRDLWSGSWLLSEVSKAAAAALAQGGARLVFPAPDSDLRPNSALAVGNKVQAIVPAADHAAVRALAQRAQDAARRRFRAIAEDARTHLKAIPLRDDVWQAQVDDYVEAHAAWARIDAGDPQGYARAVEQAGAALAARKATRDFKPSARDPDGAPGFGLPKSSLDGARETVLPEGGPLRALRWRLGLGAGEQLDCAGVAKRLGGHIDQFTPYTRIAAHAWIEALPAAARQAVAAAYEPLVDVELATRVRGNANCFDALPFDAQLLYRARLDAALRDARDDAEAAALLQALREALKPLWRSHGEPCPYGVVLLADGDRMGALLGEVGDEAHHVAVTQALSGFASGVRARVRGFAGHALYAGGDDVLAFVPLHQAFDCAQALQADFAESLQPLARRLGAVNRPTLSVGLGIGHVMEPMGALRALAAQAEKKAKGDDVPDAQRRNALGIALRVRSGAVTTLRLRWDDAGALDAFAAWQRGYQGDVRTLPSRLAYDARQVHHRTAFALAQGEPGIQHAEFRRLLDRSRTDRGSPLAPEVQERLSARLQQLGSLAALADELIVARWLAARTAPDLGDD